MSASHVFLHLPAVARFLHGVVTALQVSGLALLMQHCPSLASVLKDGKAQRLLRANCVRRSELQLQSNKQEPTKASATAAGGATKVGVKKTQLIPCCQPDHRLASSVSNTQQQQQQQHQERNQLQRLFHRSASTPHHDPLPLRRRLTGGFCRMTSRCSQKLGFIGMCLSSPDTALVRLISLHFQHLVH